MDNFIVCIPARLESNRLPGKLLLDKTGKPLIHYAIENALEAVGGDFNRVVVVTDSSEIWYACIGLCRCTHDPTPASCGTERIANRFNHLGSRSLLGLTRASRIVNLQADEPEITAEQIRAVATPGMSDLTTMVTRTTSPCHRPGTVYCAVDRNSHSLYFSREPLRCGPDVNDNPQCLVHSGIYSYWRHLLTLLPERSSLRDAEDLEQLDWLYQGDQFWCFENDGPVPLAINTQEDYDLFCQKKGVA